jgi:hypothetical protein
MMSKSSGFENFIKSLGRQMGRALDPSLGILWVDLNGVPFMFAHDPEQWGEENVLVACDFGEVPQENRCAVLEKLLAANRNMHGLWSPVFTMDPNTGHVLSMLALPLEGLDPGRTMQTMMKHVVVVENWRRTHFLEAESA